MSPDDVDRRFHPHPADEARSAAHSTVYTRCGDLAHLLNDLLPEGREKSLALTNLEQTMFWANAAIARSA